MSARAQRRLAAILAADVVGYSRMIRSDEDGTLAALKALRVELIDPKLAEHNGRIVKLMGDGMLVEFSSVVDAVRAAVETQEAVADRNTGLPEGRRIDFRVGINLGDVVIDGDDIHGDGVNVAARLEGLADPGGICISGAVHDQVKNRMAFVFEDLGEREVKNIGEPVRVWGWRGPLAKPSSNTVKQASPQLPDKPSIAVLPFNNMSNDPEQEYFSDGITEDIITDLSKVSGLLVIARNSSFAYKGRSTDVRRVCRDLGVRHVLEGSVRRIGGRVRINAQLIDGTSGGHLWAERYDRSLEDIFAVQDEVTREIVDALKVALTPVEQRDREERGKVDPEAYDCLIRGRAGLYGFTAEAMVESRVLLDRAIELDPGLSAPACAWQAISYCTDYVNGWNDAGPERLETALRLAQKAIVADENEPQAHRALALAHMWLRHFEAADQAAKRAIELDANFAGAFTTLGQVRDHAGQHESAIEALEQALRLDPRYDIAVQFLGRAQFALGRYEEAEATFKRRLVEVPRSDMTRAFLVSLYGHTNKIDEAREMWRQLLEINPAFSVERFRRVLPYKDPATIGHFLDGFKKAGLPG